MQWKIGELDVLDWRVWHGEMIGKIGWRYVGCGGRLATCAWYGGEFRKQQNEKLEM